MDKGEIIKSNKNKVVFLKEKFANGEGAFLYPDKSKYEGNWNEGKRDGFGIHTLRDGSSYSGQQKNGQHQAQVVGEEPCVMIEFDSSTASDYAKE